MTTTTSKMNHSTVLFVVLLLGISVEQHVHGFQNLMRSTTSLPKTQPSKLHYSSIAIETGTMETTPGFHDNVRKLLRDEPSTQPHPHQTRQKPTTKSDQIQEISTMEEFQQVVLDEKESLVVVRFYAPWCRACKAMSPGFHILAKRNPNVKFVQISDGTLIRALAIPSIPHAKLYHPTIGLVREQRLARKDISKFSKLLQDYERGACHLIQQDTHKDGSFQQNDWSTEDPYQLQAYSPRQAYAM